MALESVRTMLDGTGSRPLGAVPSAFDKDVLRQRAAELRRAAQEADELAADPDAPAPSLLLLDDALPGQVRACAPAPPRPPTPFFPSI
jgi:hypothetical protein